MFLGVHIHSPLWRSEDDQTPIIGLDGKHLYPVSHLVGPVRLSYRSCLLVLLWFALSSIQCRTTWKES